MTLKDKYVEAVKNYKQAVENWNTLIDKNVNLPDVIWERFLEEMQDAKKAMDNAWNEYLNNDILI